MADAKKAAYIRELVRNIQELDAIFDAAPDLENEYFDLGYNSGGANEIVDADVAVTTGDYALTSNIFKRAPV